MESSKQMATWVWQSLRERCGTKAALAAIGSLEADNAAAAAGWPGKSCSARVGQM